MFVRKDFSKENVAFNNPIFRLPVQSDGISREWHLEHRWDRDRLQLRIGQLRFKLYYNLNFISILQKKKFSNFSKIFQEFFKIFHIFFFYFWGVLGLILGCRRIYFGVSQDLFGVWQDLFGVSQDLFGVPQDLFGVLQDLFGDDLGISFLRMFGI